MDGEQWGACQAAPRAPEPGVATLYELASTQGPSPSTDPCHSPLPTLPPGGTGAVRCVPTSVQFGADSGGPQGPSC